MKLDANMLAFARSIQPSEALFSAYPADAGHGARVPVPVGGDGEPLGVLPGLGDAPAVVEVLPGALSILA